MDDRSVALGVGDLDRALAALVDVGDQALRVEPVVVGQLDLICRSAVDRGCPEHPRLAILQFLLDLADGVIWRRWFDARALIALNLSGSIP